MAAYVNNKELFEEILKSKENDELTPRALELLMKIARELSKGLSYKRIEDREDCIAFAIEDVLKYWNRFKPELSNNAFSYYTQMCKNGLAKGFKKLYGNIRTTNFISIDSEHGINNI